MARQRFSAEFNWEAVRLLEQGDKPLTPRRDLKKSTLTPVLVLTPFWTPFSLDADPGFLNQTQALTALP